MNTEDIKALSPDEIKSHLTKKGISVRDIADDLKINHSIVSQVINNKYKGSEDTIKKVWERIAFVLENKEDLNPIIYNDAALFIRLTQLGIKDKKFTNAETRKLIDVSDILSNYVSKHNQN